MAALDLNDATQAPSPDGGWSATITSVPNALIATTSSQEMIQPMGVFDASGKYIHEAVLWRGRVLMTEPDLPQTSDTLPGRWIWGGILLNHFGHFLTETTGRLWAIDAVKGAVDGIIFVSKREGDEGDTLVELQNFHKMFFDLLGIDLPIKIVTKSTKVELLEVPGQGFGIGPMAAGTKEFRAFMANRFAKDIVPVGGEKLYISRSGLSAIRGGILEETALEMLLADSGFEIYHPQKHPLPDQIARYKGAKQIVALDGSALHLLAMAGNSGQQVAMIKRRDSHASDSIVTNMAAFMQITPVVVDVILQDWIRSDRKRADRFSVGELNFTALGEQLAEAGFIPTNSAWETLTEAEAQTAIKAIEKQLKGKLTFAPVPRKGGKQQRPASTTAAKPVAKKIAKTDEAMPERRAARMAKRSDDTAPTERRLRRMEQNGKK